MNMLGIVLIKLFLLSFISHLNSSKPPVPVQLIKFETIPDFPGKFGNPYRTKYGFNESEVNATMHDLNSPLNILINFCKQKGVEKRRICEWMEFQLEYFKRANIMQMDQETLPYFFLMHICYARRFNQTFSNYYLQLKLIENYANYCPQPCVMEHCFTKMHAIIDSCRQFDKAFYATDYDCACWSPYIWDREKRNCVLSSNPCLTHNPCAVNEKCSFHNPNDTSSVLKFQCVHRDFHVSDPCIRAKNSSIPNGVKYCKNGMCVKVDDSSRFKCECNRGFKQDERLGYPNCALRFDECLNENCLHGFCRSFDNHTACICHEGWTGRSCELPIKIEWGNWDKCKPKCSIDRTRKRIQKCNSMTSYKCPNNQSLVEYEKCSDQYCNITGEWKEWSSWSLCLKKCMSIRTRICFYEHQKQILQNSTNDAYIKLPCIGTHIEERKCNVSDCEVKYTIEAKVFTIGASVSLIIWLIVLLVYKIRENKLKNIASSIYNKIKEFLVPLNNEEPDLSVPRDLNR